MSTTDWNWFFTSVSQSAAALVGIFGAFIITKILTNQTAFTAGNVKIQELIAEGKRLTDLTENLYFNWYNKRTTERFEDDLEEKLEEDVNQSPDALFKELRFSTYLPKEQGMRLIEDAIEAQKERIIREQRKHDEQQRVSAQAVKLGGAFQSVYELSQGIKNAHNMLNPRTVRFLRSPELQKSLTEELKDMDDMYAEALHLTRVISNFHSTATQNPESSVAITKSLLLVLLLFFVGVIYPLSFMPVPSNWKPALSWAGVPAFLLSLRGVLLIFITSIFTYMIGMFLNMTYQMKYPAKLLSELDKYRSLSTYSEYFGYREANEQAKAKEITTTSTPAEALT